MIDNLKPVYGNEAVTVFFSTGEKFAPFCCAAILSLLDHASPIRYYDIIILDSGMHNESKKKYLNLLTNHPNVSIRFYSVMHILDKYTLSSSRHFTVDCYSRLLIPDIIPSHTKAIYLDSDMILMGDIAELYDIDVSDVYVGALRLLGFPTAFFGGALPKEDMEKFEHYFTHVAKTRKENWIKYFTTGTLVMNLTLIRERYSHTQLLEYAERRKDIHWYLDVEVLNYFLQDKVQFLPFIWGWVPFTENDPNWRHISLSPKEIFDEYVEAGLNPKIIHFGGEQKPWINPDRIRSEEFWRVFRRTPFYAEFMEKQLCNVVNRVETIKKDDFYGYPKQDEFIKLVTKHEYFINRLRSSLPYRVLKKACNLFARS